MNLPVNRSSESPHPSGKQPPDASRSSPPFKIPPPEKSPTSSGATLSESTDSLSPRERQQPIPPPSNPKQYRAIGLIQGQYQRSAEQMTRGVLLTLDGTAIEAVLLGRVISLVKNHINLEQPHLWVVYPRIRQDDDHLHFQIVGVWEPETLSQGQPTSTDVQSEAVAPLTSVETGYFSVRGEVIYTSSEKETVIVKIRQSPKQESEKPKFFKLKLKGILPDKPVGHFWDLQVHLEADTLVIREATDLGLLPKKKPFPKFRGQRFAGQRDQRPLPADSPPLPKGKPVQEKKPSPNRPPLPKPVKGNRKNYEGDKGRWGAEEQRSRGDGENTPDT